MKTQVPLEIRPGLYKNLTEYESEGRYINGDKVRFRDGRPKKIGGWAPLSSSGTISGTPRAIHAWSTLNGIPHLCVGTEQGLYVLQENTWTSITPSAFAQGPTNNTFSRGFGSGTFGSGTFGQGDVDATGLVPLAQWTMDNYGEDIIACYAGDQPVYWDRSLGGLATPIGNAPAQVSTMLIHSPTPFVIALGCTGLDAVYNPMLVRWSNGERYAEWDPAAENSIAGFKLLQGGSKLLGGRNVRQGSLIWSDTDCFFMDTTGGTDVFDFSSIGSSCGLVGPHGHVEIDGEVFWMGTDAFYRYAGAAVEKIRTSLDEALFEPGNEESLNRVQKEKTYAGVNTQFNEIWWFYPSEKSTECDRYIVYNYIEKVWYDGTLDRTTWINNEIFSNPIATDASGNVYEHEVGLNANGSSMYSWIQTADFDIEDGDYVQFVDRFIPDIKNFVGSIDVTLVGKEYPQHTEQRTIGPFTLNVGQRYEDFRIRARTISVKYESDGIDFDYKMGKNKLRIKRSGRR